MTVLRSCGLNLLQCSAAHKGTNLLPVNYNKKKKSRYPVTNERMQ